MPLLERSGGRGPKAGGVPLESRTGGGRQGSGSQVGGARRRWRLEDPLLGPGGFRAQRGAAGIRRPPTHGKGRGPSRRRESGPPPTRLGPGHTPRAQPVLAGSDHAVLLGDEQCGRDGVLVPLDLAQQHRAAALRPGVDLGRHDRAAAAAAAASRAGGPSADSRAGGDAPVATGFPGPRGRRAAVSSRLLPPTPYCLGKPRKKKLHGLQRVPDRVWQERRKE